MTKKIICKAPFSNQRPPQVGIFQNCGFATPFSCNVQKCQARYACIPCIGQPCVCVEEKKHKRCDRHKFNSRISSHKHNDCKNKKIHRNNFKKFDCDSKDPSSSISSSSVCSRHSLKKFDFDSDDSISEKLDQLIIKECGSKSQDSASEKHYHYHSKKSNFDSESSLSSDKHFHRQSEKCLLDSDIDSFSDSDSDSLECSFSDSNSDCDKRKNKH